MKPQDFLIGLRDFFAVVVPGAIFLLCLPPDLLANSGPRNPTLALFGAAIAAYLAGSIASAAGSLLDLLVDPLLDSAIARSFWKRLADRVTFARTLRDNILSRRLSNPERGQYQESLRSFWWDHLRLRCPAAIAELDRIEATQKLFRSLVMVFAGLAIWSRVDPRLDWGARGLESVDFIAAAIAAFALYAIGRAGFLTILYRYAASYSLAGSDKTAA